MQHFQLPSCENDVRALSNHSITKMGEPRDDDSTTAEEKEPLHVHFEYNRSPTLLQSVLPLLARIRFHRE